MKKIFTLGTAAILTLSLAACGAKTTNEEPIQPIKEVAENKYQVGNNFVFLHDNEDLFTSSEEKELLDIIAKSKNPANMDIVILTYGTPDNDEEIYEYVFAYGGTLLDAEKNSLLVATDTTSVYSVVSPSNEVIDCFTEDDYNAIFNKAGKYASKPFPYIKSALSDALAIVEANYVVDEESQLWTNYFLNKEYVYNDHDSVGTIIGQGAVVNEETFENGARWISANYFIDDTTTEVKALYLVDKENLYYIEGTVQYEGEENLTWYKCYPSSDKPLLQDKSLGLVDVKKYLDGITQVMYVGEGEEDHELLFVAKTLVEGVETNINIILNESNNEIVAVTIPINNVRYDIETYTADPAVLMEVPESINQNMMEEDAWNIVYMGVKSYILQQEHEMANHEHVYEDEGSEESHEGHNH